MTLAVSSSAADPGLLAAQARHAAAKRRAALRRRILPLVGLLALLAIWAGLVHGLDVKPFVAPSPVVVVVEPNTYEDDINNMSEESPATNEVDTNVYTKLCATADFDATGRLPGRYAYHLVSCYNNGNTHVEAM